jgi:hypothetical protein
MFNGKMVQFLVMLLNHSILMQQNSTRLLLLVKVEAPSNAIAND